LANQVNLQVTAVANFSQLKAQINELKAQMAELQKLSMTVGGPASRDLAKNSQMAMQNFEKMVLATKAFNVQSVKMTNAVDQFGTKLEKGQVGLRNAWQIYRQEAQGGAKMLDDLAARQTRLMKSTFIPDPNAQGYAKAITSVNGSMKELGATADYAKIRMSALNSIMREIGTGMVNFGKNTQWAGRQLTVGLTMPLVMFGAAASKAYLDFDRQMTSMLKVYGAHAVVQSQQTLDVIQKQVTDLADKTARTLGVAMSDTVEIAKTFSAIGLEGQNLISATEATTKLMKLGDLQANQAANSMVSLQNVFKLQADQVSGAVDFLNAAKHSTSTTMQDIIDAIPRVGPIIQQMGGTYKDFVAFLVAMKESGVPAAQGANAIKSMLASIIRPTARAKADFQAMHIDLGKIASQNAGNVMALVQGLQKSLNALPQSQRLKAIEELFGKFQFARVTALMNNLGTAGSQSAKVLELYGKTNDQLAAVSKQELDIASNKTPAAQFQKMKTTLQADLIPLGHAFLKSFISIGNGIDKIVNAFRTIGKVLGPLGSLFGSIFGKGLAGIIVIGPIIMLTGLFINLAGQLFKMGNFARMFRDGWRDGKLTGALANINNYFQQQNLSLLASKAHIDEFKTEVISTADAFKLLGEHVETLKLQLGYLSSTPVLPQFAGTGSVWGVRPSMPPSANGKIGGFVRPHMYPGAELRNDWTMMSESERMMYPSLYSMQMSKGMPWLSGQGGYLERGLSAQWQTAPKGVPELLNSTYGAKPAVYGGMTGISKETMMAPGVSKLVQTHNAVVLGLEKQDALTTAQLQDIFGKSVVEEGKLSDEAKIKIEKALESVIFEENAFKERMVDHIIQEQIVLKSYEETKTDTNFKILIGKLETALQAEEEKRVPMLTAAWQEFNSTITALGMAEINKMRALMLAEMAAMPVAGAAMAGAEAQAGVAIAAEKAGLSELGAATSQSSKFVGQTIALTRAYGGSIPRYAEGGRVVGPGGPTEDKVPAMLSGGEFVIKASSVNKYGTGLLDAINGGYATGGPISYLDGGGLTARGLMGASDPYVRAHLVSDKSGYMAFLPRSINSRMQSGGVTGFELHTALQDSNAWHLLNDTGKRLGIPQDVRIRDINSAKAKILKKLELEGLEKTYVGGSFEKLIDPIIRKELKDQSWKILDHTRTIRTRADFEQALKDAEKAGVSYSEEDLARVERNLLKRELSGKTSQKSYSLIPEQLKGKGIVATATTGGGGGEGLFKNLVNSQDELIAFEQHTGMFPVAASKGGQIPAMLSNGEYVMSPEATAAHGKDFMSSINNGTAKFARGGGVGNRFSNSPLRMEGGGPIWESVQSFATASKDFIVDVTKMTAQLAESGLEAVNVVGRVKTAMAAMNAQPFAANGQLVRGPMGGATVTGTAQTQAVDALTQTSAQVKYLGATATEVADRIMITGMQLKELGIDAKDGAISIATTLKDGAVRATESLGQLAVSAKEAAAANMMSAGGALKSGGGKLASMLNPMGKEFSMGRMMGGMGLGMGISAGTGAMTKNMQEGAGKSALNAAGSLASIGGMFGPEGALIGAGIGAVAGGIYGAWKANEEKLKEAKAGLINSVTLDTNSIQSLGIKVRDLGSISIISAEKIGVSTTKLQNAIDSWKNATDPTVQDALKNLTDLSSDVGSNRQKIENLAMAKYETLIGAGVKASDANLQILSYLRAGGVGMMTAQNMITKFSKFLDPKEAFGKILNTLVDTNQMRQNYLVDAKGRIVTDYQRANASSTVASSWQTVNTNFDPTAVATAIKTGIQSENAYSFNKYIENAMTSTGPLYKTIKTDGASKTVATALGNQRAMLMNDQVFQKYQDDLAKTNPDLQKFNATLQNTGVTTDKIYQINTLMSLGWQGDAESAQFLATHVDTLNQEMQNYNATQLATNVISAFAAKLQQNQAKAAATAQAATQKKTNGLQDQVNKLQDYIDSENAIINGLNKEKQAYDKLWESQQQQIQNEQTLAGLRDKITQAGASGDLLAMSEAQGAYNAELLKQADAKRKATQDDAYDKAIAKHQANIDQASAQIKILNKQISTLNQTTQTTATSVAGTIDDITTNTAAATSAFQTFLASGNWKDKKTFLSGLAQVFKTELHIPLGTANQLASNLASSLETTDGLNFDKIGGLHNDLVNAAKGMGLLATSASGAFIMMDAMANMQRDAAAGKKKNSATWYITQATNDWKQGGGGSGASGGPGFTVSKVRSPSGHFRLGTDYIMNSSGIIYKVQSDNSLVRDSSGNYQTYVSEEVAGKGNTLYKQIGGKWMWHTNWDNQTGGWNVVPAKRYGGLMSFKSGSNGLVRGPGGPVSDMIPTMLSNGEYVVRASAVGTYGTDLLDSINNRQFNVASLSNIPMGVGNNSSNSSLNDNSVYNITVNAATNADPNEIARVVMRTIKADSKTLSTPRNIGMVG
jgi:TP901 family phage tail tape measure protein